jgi:AAHS family 4-hydroxybenzoate transporter-like MFS transporter
MQATVQGGGDQAGESTHLGFQHVLILALVVMLLTIDGVDMQILGVTVAAIASDWDTPLSAFGAAMAAGHLGAAVGATLGGVVADRIGRRSTIILGVLWFGAFTLATLLARTPEQIAVVRLIAGIGLGGCLPPALALISETMPNRLRPLGVSLCILASPLGIAIAGFAAATLLPAYGWRSMYLIFGCLPFAVAIVIFLLLPESPSFLARFPNKRAQLDALLKRLKMAPAQISVGAKVKAKEGLGGLYMGGRWRETLTIFAAFFCVYVAMTMVLNWMPSLLTRGGFSQAVAGSALSAFSLTGIAGIVLAGVLMGMFGTRRVMLCYIVGAVVAVTAIAVALPATPAAIAERSAYIQFFAIIGVAGFMLNGTMTSLFAHASTTFVASVRASGVGFATTCGRTGAIVGAFIGARILDFFGSTTFFAMIAVMVALAFVLLAVRTGGNHQAASAPAASGGAS